MVQLFCIFSLLLWQSCQNLPVPVEVQDPVAERMLLYQRSNGGWPQPGGSPIKYELPLTTDFQTKLVQDKNKLDATFDDQATNREIRYLVKAYVKTRNPAYKNAAEAGIAYIFSAQNAQGGWPQFYPDKSSYRSFITFNDQAMTQTLWTLQTLVEGKEGFDQLNANLVPKAVQAIDKGIQCILNCQIIQKGVRMVWCAQHHPETLAPAKARAFELPSFSGSESVEILRFLMHQPNPTDELKSAILAGCAFLEKVKLSGINVVDQYGDRVVIQDPNHTLWARFYDLQNHQPMFVGRDGIPKNSLAEIEIERRTGYAYYGTWPKNLLAKELPQWKKIHGL